jgi:glycosyltransferase involved in cell wall biosynthesis
VLTHDVASHRFALNHGGKAVPLGDFSPATAAGEARLLSRADVVLAISEDDAAVFRGLLPDKAVIVAPKSAPIRDLVQKPVSGRCLFVGGVNPPNREGLAWFLEHIWPEVRANQPNAILHICGGIGQTVSQPGPGVVIRGRVEKLDTEYAEAEVVIVPLLQGTGIKIKLVEACSFGKACVTTPVGLQGLPFLRDSVIETNNAKEFSQGVLRLLGDATHRDNLGQRTLAAVTAHLSPDRCYRSVLNSLN